jgi:hypothetical protein
MTEEQLDGPAALGVAGLALGAVQPGLHRSPQAVASGRRGLTVLAGLAVAAMAGRGISNSDASGIADTFAIDQ